MTGKMMAARRVNRWEGHGSKAHRFLRLALEAGPAYAYRLATLSELTVCSGSVACHAVPPHSCMNRYQSGNSGPVANSRSI